MVSIPVAPLLTVYAHLIGFTCAGWLLGRVLPASAPARLGKLLFWFGVPLSIVAFMRHAQISLALWLAPVACWVASLSGLGLAWLYLRWHLPHRATPLAPPEPADSLEPSSSTPGSAALQTPRPTYGSFLLASAFGNTGYIGYPVSLALVGQPYFAWTLLYDLGGTIGMYVLGIALAALFGRSSKPSQNSLMAILATPVPWSFTAGLLAKDVPLPALMETGLKGFAWGTVSLALVLTGMRLSQIRSLKGVRLAVSSLGIKMLVVPLLIGLGLSLLGTTGAVHRALLLQMAMPPAFATLVVAEVYELDQTLTVATLAIGSLWLLVMLPVWLILFPT